MLLFRVTQDELVFIENLLSETIRERYRRVAENKGTVEQILEECKTIDICEDILTAIRDGRENWVRGGARA